jgi:hypothetical protein|tara:strand:+ start:300 stop:1172 length:873 start_codon:yes stop_codon:yes gene_type:complete
MTELTTIDTNNYAEMAKAMGMANEAPAQKKQGMFLARLRLNHSPILGAESILVKAGTYKLEIPDGPTYYAESAIMRPFMQRFMYKKFVMGTPGVPNRYVKTVMADTLNMDLKDNDGGFNCGKPAGWIEDYNSLPDATKELIRSIKRVRVVLGTVELINAKDVNGNPVDVETTPFIWEVENRDAFKTIGGIFTKLAKMKRLPVQHSVTLNSEERKLPNGNSFYLPLASMDVTSTVELSQDDQDKFGDFMGWVQNYNEYIINAYSEKATSKHDEDLDDLSLDDIVDIEEEVA